MLEKTNFQRHAKQSAPANAEALFLLSQNDCQRGAFAAPMDVEPFQAIRFG